MDLELLFKIINFIVMPAWALLILAPNWKFTTSVVHAVFIPLVLVLFYTYFIGWALFFGGGEDGGFDTLAGVMVLFDSPVGTLAGWTHYLVFDLFVGMWIARDRKRYNIGHVWTVPCLILTYMFGPVGLGLYLLLRFFKSDTPWSLIEKGTA